MGAGTIVFLPPGTTSVSLPFVFACFGRFESESRNLASKDVCALIRDGVDYAVDIRNSVKNIFWSRRSWGGHSTLSMFARVRKNMFRNRWDSFVPNDPEACVRKAVDINDRNVFCFVLAVAAPSL